MKPLRVAILIETTSTWGSKLVEGIASYSNLLGGWQFYLEPRGKFDSISLPEDWQGDGLIGRITSAKLAEQVIASGLPAVNVSWFPFGLGRIPTCTLDPVATGRLCANHLIGQGLKHLAYCGNWRRLGFIDTCSPVIAEVAQEKGVSFSTLRYDEDRMRSLNWQDQLAEIGNWLLELPRPTGLITIDYIVARQVLEACRLARIKVPAEVAVLSVEFDQLSSDISLPQLSGVDGGPRRIGYEAAAILNRLINNEARADEVQLLPPVGIVQRRSTEVIGLTDPVVTLALEFIRENTHRALRVSDVVEQLAISRRSLEQRFMSTIGRSPACEIRRHRLECAKRLLTNTALPMATVAIQSGYETVAIMTRAFRREMGMTPTTYRETPR